MAIIAPPLPQPTAPIKKFDGRLKYTLEATLLKIRERGEYSRNLSNLSDAEFLNSDEDGLEPYGMVRLGSSARSLTADLNPAPNWDGGYHIRSYCNYIGNHAVPRDFKTFGGVFALHDSNSNGYLSMTGTDANPRGITLPSFNAGRRMEMTLILAKAGNNVPHISFRNQTNREQQIELNDGTTELATIDGSWVTNANPSINTRTITRAIRNGSFFTLKISLWLGYNNGFSQDGSLIVIENGDFTGSNRLNSFPIQGTFGGGFDPRDEKINNNSQQSPGDYMITPSISNCFLYYVDCLVGNQSNRIIK